MRRTNGTESSYSNQGSSCYREEALCWQHNLNAAACVSLIGRRGNEMKRYSESGLALRRKEIRSYRVDRAVEVEA